MEELLRTHPMHIAASRSSSTNTNGKAARDLALATPAPTHTVQFYEDEEFLGAAVADFLAAGLSIGQSLVVIATGPRQNTLARRLAGHGFDIDAIRDRGQLTLLDARDTLSAFMVDDVPHADRFKVTLTDVLGPIMGSHDHIGLRMYGEMVDLLWKDGNTEGAIRLEELWNELGESYPFSLLCAYAMGNFYKSADIERFQQVCRHHTHVIPTERYTQAPEEARLLEITLLEQRARALEAEIEERQNLEHRLRAALTARHRAEDALRENERELKAALAERNGLLESERAARAEAEAANRSKSEFLALMSHELRTPLNAIGGYVELLDLGIRGPVSPEQRSDLARIQRSQQHLLGLINQVLNYARIETGTVRYELADLRSDEIIADVEPLVAPQLRAKRLAFTVGSEGGVGVVRADLDKVRQILLNLLSNAAKFTDAGGSVALTCETVGRTVFLRVRDSGRGIPPDRLESIFEPFVQIDTCLTRTEDGVGLGLAISRDLARGMGGELTVESAVGEGSTFTLALPRAAR